MEQWNLISLIAKQELKKTLNCLTKFRCALPCFALDYPTSFKCSFKLNIETLGTGKHKPTTKSRNK